MIPSHHHSHDPDHTHDCDHHDHDAGKPSHGHAHSHAPTDFGRAFLIGVILNTAFVVIEAVYGFVGGSMALLADAGHNLSDVLGLLVAWASAEAAKRPPSARYTYGFHKTSILSALLNGGLTLIAAGAIAIEAIQRFMTPVPVATSTVMIVAAIGAIINGVTAWLFSAGRHGDLNIRGAYLHMAADSAVSLGVVISGLVIAVSGWLWLDPAISLVIVAVIIWSSWDLVREGAAMSFAAVPSGIDPVAVRAFLLDRESVSSWQL